MSIGGDDSLSISLPICTSHCTHTLCVVNKSQLNYLVNNTCVHCKCTYCTPTYILLRLVIDHIRAISTHARTPTLTLYCLLCTHSRPKRSWQQLGKRSLHRRGRTGRLCSRCGSQGGRKLRLSPGLPAHTLPWWRHRLRDGYTAHLEDP